jgi:hypothetical protein
MRKHKAENERIKRAYFIYLKEARRLSEQSIDAAAAALSRFEEYTKYREFKRFHTQQAVGFKRKGSLKQLPRKLRPTLQLSARRDGFQRKSRKKASQAPHPFRSNPHS